jgi:hypothetical protein
MNTEIYNLINKQFKALISPRYYNKGDEPPYESTHYWATIPEYLIARCPICKQPHIQQIDNYCLWHWLKISSMSTVNYDRKPKRCNHFVGVQSFLNFNAQLPSNDELSDKSLTSNQSEVPFINPYLLPDYIESYAVIHALPVGKIDKTNFSLPYTVFTITYYAEPWEEAFNNWFFEWTKPFKIKQNFDNFRKNREWGMSVEEADSTPFAWDLNYWVNKGKLFWLDLNYLDSTNSQLALPLNKLGDTFPYNNISGVKFAYTYTMGRYLKGNIFKEKKNFQKDLPLFFFRIGRQIIDGLDITKLTPDELQDYYRLMEEQKK